MRDAMNRAVRPLAFILLCGSLGACASTASPGGSSALSMTDKISPAASTPGPSKAAPVQQAAAEPVVTPAVSARAPDDTPKPVTYSRPIPAAPDTSDGVTRTVVIAANPDGVGTSWRSVTENEMARSAAELSNIGGAPVVLGTVGVVMAADAKPKGRANRLTKAVNAGLVGEGTLDEGLKEALADELAENEIADAEVRVAELERLSDLPEDAWLVFTDYQISTDGTALRATAKIAHTDDYRAELQLAQEYKRQRLMHGGAVPDIYEYRGMTSTRLARRQREYQRRVPRFNGTFVYHSEPLLLPAIGDISDSDTRTEMEDKLVEALEAEHVARRLAADENLKSSTERANGNKTKISRATRRRDRAYKKADSLLKSSLKDARDGEISKMETLVLGMARWRAGEETGDTPLTRALDEAHAFFAETLTERLPVIGTGSAEDQREPTLIEASQGMLVLDASDDGRKEIVMLAGETAGTVVSLPDEGVAEYGGQTADPLF